jgi:predicted DNA-binding transcriptional regulator AlpA
VAHKGMTNREVHALPVVVDILTAGKVFGLARNTTYELVRRDEFPCRILRVGSRYRVTKSAILEALGLDHSGKPITSDIAPVAGDDAA